jgi:hypothetical protein
MTQPEILPDISNVNTKLNNFFTKTFYVDV